MALGERMEMIEEERVDGCAAKRTQDRHRLYGDLLRYDYPKASSDLAQEAHMPNGRDPGRSIRTARRTPGSPHQSFSRPACAVCGREPTSSLSVLSGSRA